MLPTNLLKRHSRLHNTFARKLLVLAFAFAFPSCAFGKCYDSSL